MTRRPLFPILLCLLFGCEGVDIFATPPLDPNCEAGDPEIRFATAAPSQPVQSDLTLAGSIEGFDDLAIHRVVVAGVPATNEGFNFQRWSVTIPLSRLLLLAAEPQGSDGGIAFPTALIDVYMEDACGARYEQDPAFNMRVEVLGGAGVVRDLTLDVVAPGTATFIPADGIVPATVTVEALASSATGVVELRTSIGTFADTGERTTSVVLQSAGMRARASALLSSTTPGQMQITARANLETASATLTAAGAPTIFPPAGTLLASQVTLVRVESLGRLESCSATPSPGFRVTSMDESVDLTRFPLAPDGSTPGTILVRVEAQTVTAEARTQLQCQDIFGQTARGEYTVLPPPPPEP